MGGLVGRVGHVPDLIEVILLSVKEALANVVVHAYPADAVGFVELHACCTPAILVVDVLDYGMWQGRPSSSWGRRAKIGISQRKRMNVCTSCLKAGKVTRG